MTWVPEHNPRIHKLAKQLDAISAGDEPRRYSEVFEQLLELLDGNDSYSAECMRARYALKGMFGIEAALRDAQDQIARHKMLTRVDEKIMRDQQRSLSRNLRYTGR